MKARITQDQNAFALFNGAFTTSLTADGYAIVSSHLLLDGVAYSNLLTAAALSDTTLYNLIVMLRQQPDQANVIMGNTPAVLVVPTRLWKTAVALTESALIVDSTAAQNQLNVYRSAMGITVYTSPYLDSVAGGSDTQYFLLSRNHKITRLIRQGVQTALTDWSVSKNRTYFYQANFRETVYCPDYAGIVGCAGA